MEVQAGYDQTGTPGVIVNDVGGPGSAEIDPDFLPPC